MFVLLLPDKLGGDGYFDKRSVISIGQTGWWPNDKYLFKTEEEAIEYAKHLLTTEWFRLDLKLSNFEVVKTICLDFDEYGLEYCTEEYLDYHPDVKKRVVKESLAINTDELIANREHEARVEKFKIYEPPVMVGDHIFLPKPEIRELEVSYLGWDGNAWDITLTAFENGLPTDKTEKIRATSLDGIYWFKTKKECQRFINNSCKDN